MPAPNGKSESAISRTFNPMATVVFRNRHSRIDRCFTGSYRHVRSIGNDNRTFHQAYVPYAGSEFGEFGKDFHNLVGTLTPRQR